MKNKLRTVAAIGALVGIVGCAADNKTRPSMMQAHGEMRFEPDKTDNRVIWAYIFNHIDIGFDADRAADRHAVITNALTPQCGAPTVELDLVTQTSAAPLHTMRLYTLKVRCPNGATRPAS
jgi:hypothetical protein